MRPCPAAIKAFQEASESDELALHMDENDGLCLACGEWTSGGCEPDARNYQCEACDARAVYGAEECLLMMALL
jgi:hypothetical protein